MVASGAGRLGQRGSGASWGAKPRTAAAAQGLCWGCSMFGPAAAGVKSVRSCCCAYTRHIGRHWGVAATVNGGMTLAPPLQRYTPPPPPTHTKRVVPLPPVDRLKAQGKSKSKCNVTNMDDRIHCIASAVRVAAVLMTQHFMHTNGYGQHSRWE